MVDQKFHFDSKDLILPLQFPTAFWCPVGIALHEITRTLGTSQTEEGWGQGAQERPGIGMCHLTGVRLGFGYLRFENEPNGKF